MGIYKLCRKINVSGNILSGVSVERTVYGSLQNEIGLRKKDVGRYAVGVYYDDLDYPYYWCPDGLFWVNGIDGKDFLHQAINLYDSASEAQEEIGKYKGFRCFEVVQVVVDSNDSVIWLESLPVSG